VNLRVSVEARVDIEEAVEWLRERSPSLPERFKASLQESFDGIVEHPSMFPNVHRELREHWFERFRTLFSYRRR
jgi:plasmid stabilization system protein ParE